MAPEVVTAIRTAEDVERKQYESFQKEQLEDTESFQETIHKNNLTLLKASSK